jgi:hypothetical protein
VAGSESDIWAQDSDPILGPIETALYALGSTYLQHVHRDLHTALALPANHLSDLQDAYPRIQVLAKASDREREALLNRAYTSIRALLAKRGLGQQSRGVDPEDYDRLITATTDKWRAEGRITTRAQRLAVAAHIAGHLRAQAAPHADARRYITEIGDRERERVQYANARAAMYVTRLDENTRYAMRQVIYGWEQDRGSPSRLEQSLREAFAALNRDWRRIAITEASFSRANGVLGALRTGTRVEWRAAADACPHCRRLHLRSFEVVAADAAERDPQSHVWVGKASAERGEDGKRRPVGSYPAIPLHPHCRCAWRVLLPDVGPVAEHIRAMGDELVALARQP